MAIIPLPPKAKRDAKSSRPLGSVRSNNASRGSSSGGGRGSSGGGGGSASSGGARGSSGGGGSASSAQKKEDRKAAAALLRQAKNQNLQAKTLRNVLDVELKQWIKQNNSDIQDLLKIRLKQYRRDNALRAADLMTMADNTEKAAASTEEQGLSNLVRERQDSMASVLEQGAGETDAMRTLLMAARNWHANAAESNRAYFDSMASLNQNVTDLNTDARTAMQNAYAGAQESKEKVWQDYYSSRHEAAIRYGDIRTQQLDYLAQAEEVYGVKTKKKKETRLKDEAKWGYETGAKAQGDSYDQRKIPKKLRTYKALDPTKPERANTNLAAAVTVDPVAKAEGASLRKWDA